MPQGQPKKKKKKKKKIEFKCPKSPSQEVAEFGIGLGGLAPNLEFMFFPL